MKLISMTDFILEQNKILEKYKNHLRRPLFERCVNYANFLKQPLNLGMFVPCDEEGCVLDEPIFHEPNNENEIGNYQILIDEYNEAKEKVLFEGFEITDETEFLISKYGFSLYFNQIEDFNIEHLLTWSNEIQLTENAIKQIGL